MIPIKDDNPRIRPPVITVALIGVNILVFFYQLQLGPQVQSFVREFGAIPSQIVRGQDLHTLLTSMFLHGGIMHLGGNMLYLWIFGDNVEGYLGHVRFLLFYMVCGLGAAVAHIFLGGISEIPMIGASGAISGVLGAYLVKYPGARVLVVIPIFWFLDIRRISALFVLGFWFVIQLFSGLMTTYPGSGEPRGGVAFWAHVGGFVAGMLLVKLFGRRSGVRRSW